MNENNTSNDAIPLQDEFEQIRITDHAFERAKERFSLNKKALERLAQSAFEKGIKHSDTSGRLKRYIDKLYLDHKKSNNIKIYGEIIFFFRNNVLITLYQPDSEIKKILKHFR